MSSLWGAELERDPPFGRHVLTEAMALYRDGRLRALPGKTYALNDAGDALRDMANRNVTRQERRPAAALPKSGRRRIRYAALRLEYHLVVLVEAQDAGSARSRHPHGRCLAGPALR